MADYVKFFNEGRRIAERASIFSGKTKEDVRELLLKAVAHFRSWHGGADFGNMNWVAECMLRKGFVEEAIDVYAETGNDVGLTELLKNPKIKKKHVEKIVLILQTRPYLKFACQCPLIEEPPKVPMQVER
ncbi:MAG: hypothetical protein ACPL06_02245 [Candidatus Anstonellales archaeon]